MAVSPEDRRHLQERIAEVTDERAARTMSELFDEDREDPGILARFDQQDAMLGELSGRLGRLEERVDGVERRLDQIDARFDQIDTRLDQIGTRFDQVLEMLDVKLDAMRYEVLASFRGEIQTAVNGQWRTVLVGMATLALLLVATSLALGQIL